MLSWEPPEKGPEFSRVWVCHLEGTQQLVQLDSAAVNRQDCYWSHVVPAGELADQDLVRCE